MKGAPLWGLYALLLAAAVGVGLAVRSDEEALSPTPSATNRSGPGLAVLFTYLEESGAEARTLEGPLTRIPEGIHTLVIAEGTAREVTAEEVTALDRFVRAGGNLVYLVSPAASPTQRKVFEWLDLTGGPRLDSANGVAETVSDPLGVTLTVWRPEGWMAGAARLRVNAGPSLQLDAADAVPVAGQPGQPAVWWRALDQGQIWIAPVELAQNRRLEMADNAVFWGHVAAAGPIAFDEWHHLAEPLPPATRGLWIVALQLVACTALFWISRGARLGPARPTPVERHRSTTEYLQSFAWLTRRAEVEAELLPELYQRFRIFLHQRAGIAVTLADDDVARELTDRWHFPAGAYRGWVADLQRATAQPSPAGYARLAAACARLERLL